MADILRGFVPEGTFNNGCFLLRNAGGVVVTKSKVQFDAMVLAQSIFPHEALLHRIA